MRRFILIATLLAATVAHAGGKKRGGKAGGGGAPLVLLLDCPLQSDLTCTTGETLTFTRTGTGATCMATGLSEDTLISAGPAENVACFNDVHGIRVIGAVRNELGGSETFDDSVADWLGLTMPATVVLDQDDSPLVGVDALADKLTDDDIVVAERVRQSVALSTAGKYRESVWLRDAQAHTAALQVEVNTAGMPTTQTCNASVLTTYKRFDCVLDATGLTFTAVEARIYPTVTTDGALQDDVFAWGAQLAGPATAGVAGAYRVPYCRSLGAGGTTCGDEAIALPEDELRNSGGAFAIDYTPFGATTDTTQDRLLLWDNGTDVLEFDVSAADRLRSNDGTTSIDRSAAIAALASKRVGLWWIGGTRTVRNVTDGTSAVGAYDGAFAATHVLKIGGNDTDRYAWGWLKYAQIYSKPTTRGPAYTALLDCSLQSDLSCASGDTLTFTRATVGALCPGTGDEDNFVTEPAINTACFRASGLCVSGAITNVLHRSEAICTGPWENSSGEGGEGQLDCTADQYDSPLSGADSFAEKLSDADDDERLTRIQHFLTTTAGSYMASAWMCTDDPSRRSMIGAEVKNGLSFIATNYCNTDDLPLCGAGWSRRNCAVVASGTFDRVVFITAPAWGAASETGAIGIWGAQLQAPGADIYAVGGLELLPYCRSLGAGATTCAAELLTTPLAGNLLSGGGTFEADVTPIALIRTEKKYAWFLAGTDNEGIFYKNDSSGNASTFDGTTGTSLAVGTWSAGATRRYSIHWRNNKYALKNVTAGTRSPVVAFDGGWKTVSDISFGGRSNSRGWSCFKNVRIYGDANPLP